jgi:hypothetical protein
MPGPSCPSCGEATALSGRPQGADIEITCDSCGTRFLRGERRCEACGSPGAVEAEQRMTRHPRGNMLAVVGVRNVPLCPRCDGEVLADAQAQRRPVPEGYVSRFLYGEVEELRPVRTMPKRLAGRPVPRSGGSQVVRLPETDGPPRSQAAPRLVDPTVRQGIEQFLLQADQSADRLVLVLLGALLGPSTRVSSLDSPLTQGQVAVWFEEHWGRRSGRTGREAVRLTLVSLAGFWQDQGWVSLDLAGDLQSQDDQQWS